MTTCILVAALIQCTIAPGTVPTPQQAAAILAPHQTVVSAQRRPDVRGVVHSSQPSGPYRGLELRMPERRLDGSLWTDPPWVSQTYLPWGGYRGAYSGLGGYVFQTRVDGPPRGEHRRRGPR